MTDTKPTALAVAAGSTAGRGIYDCDDAHRSPLPADYERIFQSGMIAVDTNVLLNLYRSNERTRADTLAVLSRLRDRLWVPHQVLTEFWRNRESTSVRDHHSAKAAEACTALDRSRRSAHDALDRWVADVHLKNAPEVTEPITKAKDSIVALMESLKQLIEGQARKDALSGTAETHTDPVLIALEPLLHGRIGEPLSADDHDRAVGEAQKRADDQIPPGYKDFEKKPAEQAAGDYLLWVQLLKEAKARGGEVLLVTGDVKEDWWVKRNKDIPARPRMELVVEMREHAQARFYMLTPSELLSLADVVLGLQVDEGSVSDLEQLSTPRGDPEPGASGWTPEALDAFLRELRRRYPAQAKAVIAAAAGDGSVDRATVYELAGYSPDRQLKGFTRPVSTVTRELEDEGVLTGDEPFLLRATYPTAGDASLATGFRVPPEVVPLLRELLEGTSLWPAAAGSEGGPSDDRSVAEPGDR